MPSQRRRPNILFLYSDQHRAGDMSCAGHPVVKTPAMDRLAAAGTRFTDAYCSVPLCVPSRVSVLTGRYAHNSGVMLNISHLRLDEPNFVRQLQRAGYLTCFIGKLHLATACRVGSPRCDGRLRDLGFEHRLPTYGKERGLVGSHDCIYRRFLREHDVFESIAEDYRGRLEHRPYWYAKPFPVEGEYLLDNFITHLTRRWIEDYADERPFFLWCNWGGPHPPWDAPSPYDRLYQPDQVDGCIADPMERMPEALRERCLRHRGNWPDEAAWRRCKAMYYGNINVVDDGIAALLATLEEKGLLDDTLIVYSSDHGEMLFDHGMMSKGVMYEPAIKVPLLVSWPRRVPPGRVSSALTSSMDLVPMMLEAAGAEPLEICHGMSPWPVLTGGRKHHRSYVAAEMMKLKMVREGRWKYVYHPAWEMSQLFDLEQDPDELHNLAGDPAWREQEERMKGRMLHWLSSTDIQPNTPLSRVGRADKSGKRGKR